MNMKELILIRHGQTDANKNLLYCGSTDLPLNEEGVRLLREIRAEGKLYRAVYENHETFRGHNGDHCSDITFCTSGMLRAEQTLQILFGDVPHRVLPDFREFDFGEYEMKSYDMLKDDPGYQVWLNTPGTPAPGGESSDEMKARVLRGLQQLQAGTDRKVLLVTHGGVIIHIMRQLFPEAADRNNRYKFQPAGGHGFRIIFGEEGTRYEKV